MWLGPALGLLVASAPAAPAASETADARIWARLDAFAEKAGPTRPARIAIAEVAYPRSVAEAHSLKGNTLVLVTAMAREAVDLPITRVTIIHADRTEVDLDPVAGQTDHVGQLAHPAIKVFGPRRFDGLYSLPLIATRAPWDVWVTFGHSRERLKVLSFPQTSATYRQEWPVFDAEVIHNREIGKFAAEQYPFFRVPPIRSPGTESTCAAPAPSGTKPAPSASGKGSIDKEIIRAEILTHGPEAQSCYQPELDKNQKLSGKVMVQFTIAATGDVIASTLQQSTINNKTVESCIVGVVRCWKFPPPAGGGIVIISYPFVFTPGSDE
jgi:TonB family protein